MPGVLVIPATGAGERDLPATTGATDPLSLELAEALGGAGLATYRYDQRGTGESKLAADVRLSFDDLVADAKAGLDLLAQRKETSGKELSVVAYDEGGLIALRLAATDPRVNRLVLISTPGGSLLDVRTAQLQDRFGPESADALRSTVAGLLVTRALPPLHALRSEIQPLLPATEAGLLADLYGLDPIIDASRVKARSLIVVPADAARYAPARLAAALSAGAEVLTSAGSVALTISGPAPLVDPSDPASASHEHGAGPAVTPTVRDAAMIERITRFLT